MTEPGKGRTLGGIVMHKEIDDVGALDKIGKEISKTIKTSLGGMKDISKEVEDILGKVADQGGGKGGGGGGDMEAKMKKLQDQMKEMSDLQAEIQKSVSEITKNMK